MADSSILELQVRADFSSVSTEAQESAAAVESASTRIKTAFEGTADSTKPLEFSLMEARHAAAGLGEELGVKVPRLVSSFLSHLGGVGPALAAAFGPIAVIALTKVLIDVGKEMVNLYENAVNLKSEFEALDTIEKRLTVDMISLSNSLLQGNVRMTELSSGAIAGARERVASLGMEIVDLGKLVDASGKEFKDLGTSARASLRDFLVPTQAADFQSTLQRVGLEIKRVQSLMLNTDEDSTAYKGQQESLRLLSSFYDVLALKAQKYNQETAIASAEAQKAIQRQLEETQRKAEQAAKEAARVKHEETLAELNDEERIAKEITKVLTEEAKENLEANKSMGEEEKRDSEELAALKIKLMREVTEENNRQMREQTRLENQLMEPWKRLAQNIQQTMHQTFMGIIDGTMTIKQAFLKLGEGIVSAMVNAFTKVLAKHIATAVLENAVDKSQTAQSIANFLGFLSTKQAADKAAAIVQGTTDAGRAGAAAYASVLEALPFPINIATAPGVAATQIAATMAIAGFDMGTMRVPSTGLALLHAGEAVIPAGPAQKFRGGTMGGDVHFHINAIDGNSVKDMLMKHGDTISAVIRRQQRENRY